MCEVEGERKRQKRNGQCRRGEREAEGEREKQRKNRGERGREKTPIWIFYFNFIEYPTMDFNLNRTGY